MHIDYFFAVVIGSLIGLYGLAWLVGRAATLVDRIDRGDFEPKPKRKPGQPKTKEAEKPSPEQKASSQLPLDLFLPEFGLPESTVEENADQCESNEYGRTQTGSRQS